MSPKRIFCIGGRLTPGRSPKQGGAASVASRGRGWIDRLVPAVLLAVLAPAVQAQWLTQTFVLTSGWNAIYLHVDASYTTLDATVGSDVNNPIVEVWRWHPSSNLQFTDDTQNPVDTGSQWSSWDRSEPSGTSALQRMVGNSAYLVHVGNNVSTYTWSIQGKPLAPVNDWTATGLNLIGFPTVPVNPPMFENFLALAPDLLQSPDTQIYYYRGGDLTTNLNPARLSTFAFPIIKVNRGQAYWARSGNAFNQYFGPFELDLSGSLGVDFHNDQSSSSLMLKNLTASNLTVTLNLVASEAPPSGQTNIDGAPALLLRGNLDFTTLTYGYTNLPLNSPRSWTLAPQGLPGSQVEVVLGLNRSAMTNAPGTLLAGILRFTDSLGFSQLDAPVAATVGSSAGLWVGRALVTQVGEYLKSYQLDKQGNPVVATNGQYVVTSTNTALGAVPRAYPLRLIVHNPDSGNAALLQRVFLGLDANSNYIAATKESALNPSLISQARRVSSTHLPWTETNSPWMFNGRWGAASNLTTSVVLDYNDHRSNPFIHSYHPDHDNLDATFKNVLAQGAESYTVRRDITLNVNPPANDFASLVAGSTTLNGDYVETLTVLGLPRPGGTSDTRQFQVRGAFLLNRLSNVSTLTIVP